MLDAMFDDTLRLLEKSLDLRHMRHSLIASTVANAETPGYRALDTNFQDVLRRVSEAQKRARIGLDTGSFDEPLKADEDAEAGDDDSSSAALRLIADDTKSMGNDNNTVSLERELGKMSENELMYRVQMEILAKKIKILRSAVLGGGQ